MLSRLSLDALYVDNVTSSFVVSPICIMSKRLVFTSFSFHVDWYYFIINFFLLMITFSTRIRMWLKWLLFLLFSLTTCPGKSTLLQLMFFCARVTWETFSSLLRDIEFRYLWSWMFLFFIWIFLSSESCQKVSRSRSQTYNNSAPVILLRSVTSDRRLRKTMMWSFISWLQYYFHFIIRFRRKDIVLRLFFLLKEFGLHPLPISDLENLDQHELRLNISFLVKDLEDFLVHFLDDPHLRD